MTTWLELDYWRFTNPAAFVREIRALLESTDYKLELVIRPEDRERLEAEFEGFRALGRIKVKSV